MIWSEAASDRVKWKSDLEGYILQWIERGQGPVKTYTYENTQNDVRVESMHGIFNCSMYALTYFIPSLSVYNAELSNLFIHHDYILPTFPLVLEWMDYDVAEEQPGKYQLDKKIVMACVAIEWKKIICAPDLPQGNSL